MHRSGTSALAGLLNISGVDFGQAFIPTSSDNKTGFWEHADIVVMHYWILRILNSDWHDIRALPPQWWKSKDMEPSRQAIKEILRNDFASSEIWGVKDPRLCRLLPLWQDIFKEMACDPSYIIINRNPMEVSRSLLTRNGLPQWQAHLLWLEHMLEAEQRTRGCRRVFITYNQLLTDWHSTLQHVSDTLDFPRLYDPEKVEEVDGFLMPSLRHHQAPEHADGTESQDELLQLSASVFRALDRASGGDISGLTVEMSEAHQKFVKLRQAYLLDKKEYPEAAVEPLDQQQVATEEAPEIRANDLDQICVSNLAKSIRGLPRQGQEINLIAPISWDKDSILACIQDEQKRDFGGKLFVIDDGVINQVIRNWSGGFGEDSKVNIVSSSSISSDFVSNHFFSEEKVPTIILSGFRVSSLVPLSTFASDVRLLSGYHGPRFEFMFS